MCGVVFLSVCVVCSRLGLFCLMMVIMMNFLEVMCIFGVIVEYGGLFGVVFDLKFDVV